MYISRRDLTSYFLFLFFFFRRFGETLVPPGGFSHVPTRGSVVRLACFSRLAGRVCRIVRFSSPTAMTGNVVRKVGLNKYYDHRNFRRAFLRAAFYAYTFKVNRFPTIFGRLLRTSRPADRVYADLCGRLCKSPPSAPSHDVTARSKAPSSWKK